MQLTLKGLGIKIGFHNVNLTHTILNTTFLEKIFLKTVITLLQTFKGVLYIS